MYHDSSNWFYNSVFYSTKQTIYVDHILKVITLVFITYQVEGNIKDMYMYIQALLSSLNSL